MIKQVKAENELTEQDINPEESHVIIDPETEEPVNFDGSNTDTYPTQPEIVTAGPITADPCPKVYVAGVDVSVLNERVQHLDANGKLITETLKDYTKKSILQEFRTLDDFLAHWNSAHKKKAVIEELEAHGIMVENLLDEVKKDLDVFDLICHIAWDKSPLTRRERADNVKKRNYFTKYGEQARGIINALLDKYASEGIENIEDLSVLRIDPFNQIGTPSEIVQIFGGKDGYLHAIEELENELYEVV